MHMELSPEEMELLRTLLEKDLEETRVEVHHAKNIEFKARLQAREKLVLGLQGRLLVHT